MDSPRDGAYTYNSIEKALQILVTGESKYSICVGVLKITNYLSVNPYRKVYQFTLAFMANFSRTWLFRRKFMNHWGSLELIFVYPHMNVPNLPLKPPAPE